MGGGGVLISIVSEILVSPKFRAGKQQIDQMGLDCEFNLRTRTALILHLRRSFVLLTGLAESRFYKAEESECLELRWPEQNAQARVSAALAGGIARSFRRGTIRTNCR
jgi:hypothetical protein